MRALAAVVLLSACATDAPPVEPVAQACSLQRVADLPMAAGTPYAVVPARLDGQAVSMLLDTGDERLSVRPSAARDLNLAEDHRNSTIVHGTGGTVTSADAMIQHFEFGGTEVPQSGASVAEIPMAPQAEPPVAGIIGGQVLSGYDVEFNFAARRVVLWQRSGCDTIAPQWTGPWSTARLLRGGGSLLKLDVLINGQSVNALLDTGARVTEINFDAAGRAEISRNALSSTHVVVTRGADGSDLVAYPARVRDIGFGTMHLADFPVLVSHVQVPFADMMLGVDFLQHHDLWISYAGSLAFIR